MTVQINLRITIKDDCMSIIKKVKSLIFPEIWCCAVRFNKNSDDCILNDCDGEFCVIKDNFRYWTADPFLAKKDGTYYLFFELYDRLKRKGMLGYREITQNSIGKINLIYESEKHLSYPFIFEKNGEYYIIPESNKQGELFRLKCTSFPDKWEKEKVILKDRLVDTTIFTKNGTDYYISERVDDNNVFDRIDLFYDDGNEIKECSSNPVKVDVNTARGAGNVFEYRSKLIRPSQDCSKSYGEKLNFNEIDCISSDSYREHIIKTVNVKDIKLDCKNNYIGIHTYNRLDNIEVIDLKFKGKFNLLNTLGAVIKQIKRILKLG